MTTQRISMVLLPAFMLLLSFSFPLQVIMGNPLLGGLPYILLALHFLLFAFANHKDHVSLRLNFSALDWLVSLLVASFVMHLARHFIWQEVPTEQMVRIFLVYICSSWIYVYLSRFASHQEIRRIWLFLALAALAMGLQWAYDSYMKAMFEQVNWYQHKMYEYIKVRNDFSDSEVNGSLLSPWSRSYGLLDKHTTTGAFVALGGLCAGVLYWDKAMWKRATAFLIFFIILSIGMATAAWGAFILCGPAYLIFGRNKKFKFSRINLLFAMISWGAAFFTWSLLLSNFLVHPYEKTMELLQTQYSYVVNIDGKSAPVSYFQLYRSEVLNYVNYIRANPEAAIVGEGFWGHGKTLYPRGGDVAIAEWLCTLGIPLFCFAICILLVYFVKMVRVYRRPGQSGEVRSYILYAVTTLVLLLLTLVHYNSLANKSIFFFLYIALGLAARCVDHPGKEKNRESPDGGLPNKAQLRFKGV